MSVSAPRRRRIAEGALFPDSLAQCRPILGGDWSRVRMGSDSDVGRLRSEHWRMQDEAGEARLALLELRDEIDRLEAEAARPSNAESYISALGRLPILKPEEVQQTQNLSRMLAAILEIEGRLADLVSQHDRAIRSLTDGFLYKPGGLPSERLSSDRARELAADSIRLVGGRLASDDLPPPKPSIAYCGPKLSHG